MAKRFSLVLNAGQQAVVDEIARPALFGIVTGALVVALSYAFIPLQQQPQTAALLEPLDCPFPAEEGETWIQRRWIQHGELRLECTHIAGFSALDLPTFDLPTLIKVGRSK